MNDNLLQRIPLQKKLLSAFGILFTMIGLFTGALYSEIQELQTTTRWLAQTQKVIADARHLAKLMIDQESGLRGYLIVGKESFLEPFHSGKDQFKLELSQLKQTVKESPGQLALLEEVERLANEWHLAAANPEIAERKRIDASQLDMENLQRMVASDIGLRIFNELRDSVDKLVNHIRSTDTLANQTVRHQAEVQALYLIKHMIDRETTLRGFLITGRESLLESWAEGQKGFSIAIDKLQRTRGMDDQSLQLTSEIKALAQEWEQLVAGPTIDLRQNISRNRTTFEKMTGIVESEIGKTLTDTVRVKLDDFVKHEQATINARREQVEAQRAWTTTLTLTGALSIILLGFLIVYLVNRSSRPLVDLIDDMQEISESGDFTRRVDEKGMYEVKRIGEVFNRMAQNTEQQAWLKSSSIELSQVLQETGSNAHFAERIIACLGELLACGFGAIYLFNEQTERYELKGSYRFKQRKHAVTAYGPGEGLVGQCALERKMIQLNRVPADYTLIHSGLGEAPPDTVTAIPVVFADQALAVIELAVFGSFSDIQQALIEEQVPNIALGLRSMLNSIQTKELLEETRAQSEELQVREEELNSNNQLLEKQAQELRHSQLELQKSNAELQTQQEELRVANEELEEKAQELNASQAKLEEQNQALSETKHQLEQHANELTLSSKYKSEFLANMSHELRTPLNSLLILSKLLMDNKEGTLTERQVDYARTVHDSGEDLLNLINDILDLAKIESGRMDIHADTIQLSEFVNDIRSKFNPVADKKGISLTIDTDQAPQEWHTDSQKLNQIIKNLLSNAIKFTEHGGVTVRIGPVMPDIVPQDPNLKVDNAIAFSVIDTGIGISADKQNIIFEAFKQADGTTSRKFGGTGLGLSISRELSRLLQGEIHLHSEHGKGSTFTLIIPNHPSHAVASEAILSVNHDNPGNTPVISSEQFQASGSADTTGVSTPEQTITPDASVQSGPSTASLPQIQIDDDRETLKPGDKALLVIEDDPRFASIIADVAHERGFGILIAERGHSGIQLANQFQPSGIVLDIGLPDLSGWDVLEQLKNNARTRHIPVHIMSADDRSVEAMKSGAIGFYTKPVSMGDLERAFSQFEDITDRTVKKLLLIEDKEVQQKSLRALLDGADVDISSASTGAEAEKLLKSTSFDCIVLDLDLPDTNGIELLEKLNARPKAEYTPVIVYSGTDLAPKERARLDRIANRVIIKSARSSERLLQDTTLFLHRLEADLPEQQQRTIRMLYDSEALFSGRKVLIADDDMRNTFSLSAVLQEKNIDVHIASNGKEALDKLDAEPDIALVIMDIMMPEMDGYEAMRRVRAQDRFKDLPIIALTAKAMQGDRAQCMEAGASDYMTKPVDAEKLLSMMRVWLYQ